MAGRPRGWTDDSFDAMHRHRGAGTVMALVLGAVAAAVCTALVAATTDGLAEEGGEQIGLTERCTSPAGFAVAHPPGWSTNQGTVVPSCTRFGPAPFALAEGTDMRVAPIAASVESVAFDRLAAPDPRREQTRADTVVDGRRAVRIERIAAGRGLYPDGTPTTSWLIDLGDGATTLVIDAVGLSQFDHERAVRVLDHMIRTLEISAGPPAEAAVVGRVDGSGGTSGVTATPGAGQICLQSSPEGQPSCLAAPAADRIVTAPLLLPDQRQAMAGVAGRDVFRVRAHRPDGIVADVLPAPVPGSELGGFAFAPGEVEKLSWYDRDGNELGG